MNTPAIVILWFRPKKTQVPRKALFELNNEAVGVTTC